VSDPSDLPLPVQGLLEAGERLLSMRHADVGRSREDARKGRFVRLTVWVWLLVGAIALRGWLKDPTSAWVPFPHVDPFLLTIMVFFGAMIALKYCLEADRISSISKPSRMVLIDPAPLRMDFRKQFEAEFSRKQNGPEVKAMRDELAASGLREKDPVEYKQRVFELAVAGYFADPRNARNLTPFRINGRVQQSVWESIGANYDLLSRLSPMDFPVLVVHGRDDPIPAASSIEGAKAMNAQLVLLDACGHVPYVEQPGPLFSALDEFLSTSDSSATRH